MIWIVSVTEYTNLLVYRMIMNVYTSRIQEHTKSPYVARYQVYIYALAIQYLMKIVLRMKILDVIYHQARMIAVWR